MVAGLMLVLLILFLLAHLLEIGLLVDPTRQLGAGGVAAATTAVTLLVGDVLLPVPSSAVMVALGSMFGIVVGTGLSWVGSLGAAALGFWLGRTATSVVERVVGREERRRVDHLLSRWGGLAVVATRPVPILAETVAIVAGSSSLAWSRFLFLAALGSLPPAVIHAVTGATAARVGGAAQVLVLVALMGSGIWLFETLERRDRIRRSRG